MWKSELCLKKVSKTTQKDIMPEQEGAHRTVSPGLRDIEITCLMVGRLLRGSGSIPAAGPTVVSW